MAQDQLETDGVYDKEIFKRAGVCLHCGGPKYQAVRQKDAFGNHEYNISDFLLLNHAVHTPAGVFWGKHVNHCRGEQQLGVLENQWTLIMRIPQTRSTNLNGKH